MDGYPSTPWSKRPPLDEQSCTVNVLQVSLGVSWPLFIIGVLCTGVGMVFFISNNSVNGSKEMKIKPVQQGRLGPGAFAGQLARVPL